MPRIVDLSMAFDTLIPVHKSQPRPILLPFQTHESTLAEGLGDPGDPFTAAVEFIGGMSHAGTHVDAFFHTNPKGETIDVMPIEMFMGKAVCLDLTHIPDLGDIDVADLEKAEAAAGVPIDGHIVLINTGLHARHFPRDSVMHANPGLTGPATHWLADRGSVLHGIEGPSTDRPNSSSFPSHRVCRDRGITHVEWLCNLEQLVGMGEFQFQAVPIKLARGSGAPVRAFAMLQD